MKRTTPKRYGFPRRETRPESQPLPMESLPSALEFAILEFGQYPKRYEELFLARGADSLEVAPGDPSKLKVLCASLSPDTLAETLQALQSVIEKSEIDLVRLDAKSQPVATKAATRLQQWGSTPETFPLCGRSFQDQVWWKRWVVAWSPRRRLSPFGWVTADDEPVTPIPNGFSLDWLCEDSSLPQDCWELC